MWLLDRFTDRGRARRRLRTAVALAAGSAEGMFVRVRGAAVVIGEPLHAPLTGAACVAYRALAKIGALASGNPPGRILPPDRTRCAPFIVERTAGEHVIVDGEHALFDVPWQVVDQAGDRGVAFLAMHGATSQLVRAASYKEIAITPGMLVEVAGVLLREPVGIPDAGERAFRAGPGTLARLTGNAEHPLVIRQL